MQSSSQQLRYSSRYLIQWLWEQGYSDRAIAEAVGCSRETITRIRLGTPGYDGKRIYAKLVSIVRQLQQQQKQPEQVPPQQPEEAVRTVAAAPVQIRPPQSLQPAVVGSAVILCTFCREQLKGQGYLLPGQQPGPYAAYLCGKCIQQFQQH